MSTLTLAQRIEAIDGALAGIPHAFGGALALAYYAEPRATIDIDVNVFVPTTSFDEVAEPLVRLGAAADDPSVEARVRRDGQVRVLWDATPIDLFFSYDAFHDAAGRARRFVPFAGTTIPILSADHLMVCKVIFDRPKDWSTSRPCWRSAPRSMPARSSGGWAASPATPTPATTGSPHS